jgi:outer membrane protein
MKKVLIISMMFFLASGITVKAQTEKGKFLVAGSNRLELNIGSEKQKYDGDFVEGTKVSYFDFDFQPRAGYFFIKNLAAGLFMDVDIYSYKDEDENYGYTYKGTTFIIGPFVRYYIPVCDKLIPFAEGQVGFGIDNYKYQPNSGGDWTKTNEGVFTYRIGGGATYFFNEMVGADLFLGFLHDSYKLKDDDNPERAASSKYIYNEFIMQLGIVVILD